MPAPAIIRHLWLASVVIVTATAAESPPPTPPLVAEAFVRVLVGFGGGRAAEQLSATNVIQFLCCLWWLRHKNWPKQRQQRQLWWNHC